MNNSRLVIATMVVASLMSEIAEADTGPVQSPLRVIQMYTKDNNGNLYVEFQAGAMPGCYGNAGGYLTSSNSFFKELYAQVLTMVAMGGIRAMVVYTHHTTTGNWGDCTIDGIYMQPSPST